jgi:uncharacterized protein Veg
MPQDQMLADVKKIVERHNGRRVILSVDDIVGGSRRAGTAAMVIEEKLEYVFLLRFDKTPVLNSIIYVDKCLLLLINKLQLEPLVVVYDQDLTYEKYLNTLKYTLFVVESLGIS